MKKFFLVFYIIFVFIFTFSSTFDLFLQKGDILNFKNLKYDDLNKIPSAYYKNDEFFFRAGGSKNFYTFNLGEDIWNITIKPTKDSTILFYDENTSEQNIYNQKIFIEELKKAKKYIYMSIYDIDNIEIVQTLKDLSRDGIYIKIVLESQNQNTYSSMLEKEDNIELKYDSNYALMHNKFIIVDGYCLITGSTNLTNNGLNYNSNNMIFIYNNDLIENYILEFEEQFYDELFGKKNDGKKLNNKFDFNSGYIESYFTPEDNLKQRIIDLINSSEKNIYVMIFTFTDKEIADALIKAKNRGVEVKVIMENFQAGSKWSTWEQLKSENVEVIVDKNSKVFHHKVIIFDEKKVLTGSFNFTNSAQNKNDENSIIIHSSEISEEYIKEFKRYWNIYNL
jgi:phosphatidylserine/phosphatidylglycerophosphate/cardiolipin synthase-like enzyme